MHAVRNDLKLSLRITTRFKLSRVRVIAGKNYFKCINSADIKFGSRKWECRVTEGLNCHCYPALGFVVSQVSMYFQHLCFMNSPSS